MIHTAEVSRRLSGWAGVPVLILGWLVVVAVVAGGVWLTVGDDEVDTSGAFRLPGGVALEGSLECTLGAAPEGTTSVSLTAGVETVTALLGTPDGTLVAGDEGGRLYRGQLADGTLSPWPAEGEPLLDGPVRALDRTISGDHLFAATSARVLVLDVATGEVLGDQPLPAGTDLVDVAVAQSDVYAVDRAEDRIFRAVFAYEDLGEFEAVQTREPLTGLGAARLNVDGEALYVSSDGGVARLATGTLRPQMLPLAVEPFTATEFVQGGTLDYLSDGTSLRVLELSAGGLSVGGLTGRITEPIPVPGAEVTALASTGDALVLAGSAEGRENAALTVTGLAECTVDAGAGTSDEGRARD